MHKDPAVTDSDKYKVVFGNDKVRVIEYKDMPGDKTNVHYHPNNVMYFLSSFKRQIASNGKTVVVDGKKGMVTWLKAQNHVGENIGDTDTHVLLVELKESGNDDQQDQNVLGPEKSYSSL